MYPLKQSTAITVPFFVHDANGDAVTSLTNGSFTKRISKNGAAFGAMTVTISELENGWYSIPLSATHSDTNGLLSITFTNAGAKQVNLQFRVHARIPDDLAFPTVSGRSLDITATGEAGLDLDNTVGTLTAAQFASNFLTAAKIATDAITAAKIADGAIDAATFAAGAIDAAALATDAVDEISDGVWDEILTGGTHNIVNSAGRRLRQIETAQVIHNGTAQAGSLNSITLDTGASTIDGFYDHTKVVIVGGTGIEQEAIVSEYVGATRVATITPAWRVTPDATSEFNVKEGLVHTETLGGGYEGGAVFVKSSGSTGIQLYVDGTIDEAIDDGQEPNVRIVVDALNMERVELLSGASMTLTQTWNNYTFLGVGGTIAFASQDVGGSRFVGLALTGIATGASLIVARDCILIGVTANAATLIDCNIRGTLTFGAASNYTLNHCISGRDDTIIDFGAAIGNSSAFLNAWFGNVEIQNLGQTGTDVLTINGTGTVTLNANCIGGTVNIAGNIDIVNNGSGITINQDAAVTMPKINTEVDTALVDIHLDHLLAVNYDPASKPGVATALFNELIEDDGGVSRYTANALEQAPGGSLSSAVKNSIADHVLRRTLANARASADGDAVNFRSLLGAGSKLTNKVSIVGANLIITAENDTTTFGTQALTTDALADPITALDTV